MKNKLKKASAFLVVALLFASNTALAASGWYAADGKSYTKANSYASKYYDCITINISKITKSIR